MVVGFFAFQINRQQDTANRSLTKHGPTCAPTTTGERCLKRATSPDAVTGTYFSPIRFIPVGLFTLLRESADEVG